MLIIKVTIIYICVDSFHNDTLIVRVTKDVAPGEEIFNCYGGCVVISLLLYIHYLYLRYLM